MFRTLRRYQLVTDLIVAGLFLVLPVPIMVVLPAHVQDYAALLCMAVALGVRRLSPGLALGVAWLGALVQMLTGSSPNFCDFAIFGVLYATARYGGRLVRWLGLGSAVVGSIVASLYIFVLASVQNGDNLLAPGEFQRLTVVSALGVFGIFALLGLSWTLGQLARVYVRGRDSRRAQLVAESEIVVEQERNRIARDMHDVVAHSLAVVIAQADGARYARASDPDAVDAALTTISGTAREALADVRILLGQLRHAQGEAPQPALADLERLFEQLRAAGLTIKERSEGVERPLGGTQQLAVYRIVQEALTNALRHGDTAQEVLVSFSWAQERLTLTVSNALAPTSHAQHPAQSAVGHGLAGMRERAVLSGGTFLASAEPSGRFMVMASLPIPVLPISAQPERSPDA